MRRLMITTMITFLVFFVAGYTAHGIENLLKNGGFEDGVVEPWTTYNDGVVKQVVQKDPIEGKYCLYVKTVKGANFWDAGLQHPGHIFEKGKSYTLAAFLKSPDKLRINFKPELAVDPWTGYGEKSFTMTETWQEYYVETGVIPDTVNPATITFHIAYDAGEFYIDAVRFYEGSYVPGTPSAVNPDVKLTTAWGKIKSE